MHIIGKTEMSKGTAPMALLLVSVVSGYTVKSIINEVR